MGMLRHVHMQQPPKGLGETEVVTQVLEVSFLLTRLGSLGKCQGFLPATPYFQEPESSLFVDAPFCSMGVLCLYSSGLWPCVRSPRAGRLGAGPGTQ